MLWVQTYPNYVIYLQHVMCVSASWKSSPLALCVTGLNYTQ